MAERVRLMLLGEVFNRFNTASLVQYSGYNHERFRTKHQPNPTGPQPFLIVHLTIDRLDYARMRRALITASIAGLIALGLFPAKGFAQLAC